MSDAWRVYFDQDPSSRALAGALQARGMDCVTSLEMGNDRATDDVQLAFAAAEHRVLLTSNKGDFTQLRWNWINTGASHAGIVVIPQRMPIGRRVQRLAMIGARYSPEEMRDRLVYLGSAERAT